MGRTGTTASSLRLFVAVTLPAEIRDQLAEVQGRLRAAQADVGWVRPENIHLTLKFLGEIDRKRVDRIRAALAEAAASAAPFVLTLSGVGTFGGSLPRVVWVGVTEGAPRLADLARRVEVGLGRAGVPKERREFSGHLTLGRVRSPRNVERLRAALAAEPATPIGTVRVGEFVLMQSQLQPGGSIYTALQRYGLREPSEGGLLNGETNGH